MDAHRTVVVTLSGEIHLKSRRTQRRFLSIIADNVAAAAGIKAGSVRRIGGNRLLLEGKRALDQLDPISRVFGIDHVDVVEVVHTNDLDEITEHVVRLWADETASGTFAVRVKRIGSQTWKTVEAERHVGGILDRPGNRVDLSNPDHTVRIRVDGERTWITVSRTKGPGGLPMGTQEPVLVLLSGGFDSVVAAWMLMARGCPVEFVHFSLDCAQADHAVAVAQALDERWGHGVDPKVHLVDFQPIKEAIRESVDSRMRQVTLKVLMARTAAELAERSGIGALVTGDALGQVSSQTLTHLRAIDQSTEASVLRPLLGMGKEDIVSLARKVGTAELSARAKEVCDLSDGLPVAVDAQPFVVALSAGTVDDALITAAADTAISFPLSEWFPGQYQVGRRTAS